MDNEEVSQSKFKHLIDIFTPMETTNVELEKLKIMNVDEKYKYFYITKGNTYDKTKKTPEILNQLHFKLLISMSNNQGREYLQHLEKNTNSGNILNNFKSFMTTDATINLFSRLYNKTLVGGNQPSSQPNNNYLDIIYSHVFFNSTEQYIGQNINDVIIHKAPSDAHSKIYTIGNSGHLYSIHKPKKDVNEYEAVYQITNTSNKIIKEYLKYNFISMSICNNFIFILANNIKNKQFIICKKLSDKTYTKYDIPIPDQLINITYHHIYVDTNASDSEAYKTLIYILFAILFLNLQSVRLRILVITILNLFMIIHILLKIILLK